MRVAYLVSVWLHVLSAVVWVGGMFFLVLVVVPWMRSGDRAKGAALLHVLGKRFSKIGWICFAISFVTGSFNLWMRGVRPASLVSGEFASTPFGQAVWMKLGVFALMLTVSAVHDFWIGPRATELMEQAPRSPEAERMRRSASLMGRGNALLALVLVALGVILVRGCP